MLPVTGAERHIQENISTDRIKGAQRNPWASGCLIKHLIFFLEQREEKGLKKKESSVCVLIYLLSFSNDAFVIGAVVLIEEKC
jgi:hypothetical protein